MPIKKQGPYGDRNTFPKRYCDWCGRRCEHPFQFHEGQRFCSPEHYELGKEAIDAAKAKEK